MTARARAPRHRTEGRGTGAHRMKSHARVVVVGGGVVGANILYALAKNGWPMWPCWSGASSRQDRPGMPQGSCRSIRRAITRAGSIFAATRFMRNSRPRPDRPWAFIASGTLRLASTKDRLDEYLHYKDIADSFGAKAEIVGPAEVRRLWPLIEKTSDHRGRALPPDGRARRPGRCDASSRERRAAAGRKDLSPAPR